MLVTFRRAPHLRNPLRNVQNWDPTHCPSPSSPPLSLLRASHYRRLLPIVPSPSRRSSAMESLGREDIERLMFFEHAREVAEKEWHANNRDAVALTKWGGALLELAHFRQGGEAADMIEEAISKFQQALAIDKSRHDALWCLGNAFTSQGFLSGDESSANAYFAKASECFGKAVEQEPSNESYRRAKEMSAKAPQLYVELQRQLAAAGHSGGLGGSPREEPATQATKKKGGALISDWVYDAAGWVCLLGLGLGLAALQQRAAAGAAAAAK